MRAFFIYLRRLYNRLQRVYFTEEEVSYLIDIVDMWIESHKDQHAVIEDDEVEAVFENMAIAVDVRNKLWRQLRNG